MSIKINPNSIKQLFGKKVRYLREELSLSQEKLGFSAGLDLTSVNEIENGHRDPKLTTIHKLAKALEISTSELLKK